MQDAESVFVVPEPHFAIKTSRPDPAGVGGPPLKFFINVCSSDQVPPLREMTKLDEAGQEQRGIHVPVSVGPLKKEVDRAGAPCEVVDVVVHPGVAADCERDGTGGMRHFVVDLALQYVERKYAVALSHEYKLPRLRYQGLQVTGQRMRRQAARAGIAEVPPQIAGASGIGARPGVAAASGRSALSLLAETGAIGGGGSSVVPSSAAASRTAAAKAAAAPAAPPSQRVRSGVAGQAPLDIQVLSREEGEGSQAAIARRVQQQQQGVLGSAGAGDPLLPASLRVGEARTGRSEQHGGVSASASSSLLTARSSSSKPAQPAEALAAELRQHRLPLSVAVFAVLPRRGARQAADEALACSSGAAEPAAELAVLAGPGPGSADLAVLRSTQLVPLAQHAPVAPCAAPAAPQAAPQAAASPQAVTAWLRSLPPAVSLSAAVSSAASAAGLHHPVPLPPAKRLRLPEASSTLGADGAGAEVASGAGGPARSVPLTSEEVLDGATGTLLRVSFPTLAIADAQDAAGCAPPPALLPADVFVRLSPDGALLTVEAAAYQRLTLELPWPCDSLCRSAGEARLVAALLDGPTRTLTLHLPRKAHAGEGGRLPPLPAEAMATLLQRGSAAPAAATGKEEEEGAGAPAAGAGPSAASLPAPYLLSLLRRYAEAEADSTAPEPGSRQWLLAHALGEGEGEGGKAADSAKLPAPAAAAPATAAGARPSAGAGGAGELPEDRFLRADALSLHYLRQREEDRAARDRKAAEAAAERAAAAEEEALAAARQQVQKERQQVQQQRAGGATALLADASAAGGSPRGGLAHAATRADAAASAPAPTGTSAAVAPSSEQPQLRALRREKLVQLL
jgi:hypothetical protein